MRRLLRWAINGTPAVSALLFVATCVLWVRSYRTADFLPLDRWALGQLEQLMVSRGGLQLQFGFRSIPRDYTAPSGYWHESPADEEIVRLCYVKRDASMFFRFLFLS